ncbi:hypothetical protein BCR44DRAFT_54976 [Catenaria anguillulae PL171]|uniref:Ankyrin repeat-containing domain protein n=1 Tax=Catenaria anguillulae PL171 TaxID=765915 RepID=A0A1Y2HHS1_9FUNG|nr:hypothetical protein BCR44DRAFT_54976 [Catenaria anguillulae PL171]
MARGFYSTAQLVLQVWNVAAEYRYSLALQSLAQNKDKDMVLWALANLPIDGSSSDPKYYVLTGAVKSGDQDFIRWAIGLHDEPPSKTLLQSLPGASEAGQLATIQWILTDPEMNTGLDAQGKLPYNTQVHMDKIALAGHLHVLEWWAANGDRLGASLVAHDHRNKCIVPALAKRGLMQVLKWWLEQNLIPVRPTTIKDLPVIAAEHGLVELLEYCKGTPALAKKVTYSTSALTAASTNGHLHVLEWWEANKKRITCGDETLRNATEHGQLAVLDWWFDKSGCKHLVYDKQVLVNALRYGQLDVLEWWMQRSVFDQDEIKHAFSSLEVLSEWNRFSYHPSILLYLIRQGYFAPAPSDDDGGNMELTNASNLVLSAMRQPVLLHFVHKHLAYTAEHTCRLLMQQILASAVQHGTVCTLQWMLAMLGSKPTDFPPVPINHLKRILLKRDDSKATFRWLIDHQIPFDVAAVATNGPGSPYQQIEEWLVEEVRRHIEEKAVELSMC